MSKRYNLDPEHRVRDHAGRLVHLVLNHTSGQGGEIRRDGLAPVAKLLSGPLTSSRSNPSGFAELLLEK